MLKKLINFCFPHVCIFCREKSARDIDLCCDCEQTLPFIQYRCRLCGLPLAYDADYCGDCLKKPPPFDRTDALFHYQSPVAEIIKDLKFHQQLAHSQLLGQLMVMYFSLDSESECIIPVPLHPARLKERGFNQSLEIARIVSKQLKLPLYKNVCRRIRYTEPQATLPAKLRKQNVKQAFQINKNFNKKRILLIDDVVTTGHTIRECSRAFKSIGVEQIIVWCAARAR